MKKLVSFIAVLTMICMMTSFGLAEGIINTEGSYPVVNEPYEVSITFQAQGDGVDLDKYFFTAYLDYLTGLTIDWECIDPSAFGERLPILMATGDMPDAMINVGFDNPKVIRYGMQEGLLRPVNDLIDYMPNFQAILETNPAVLADITCLDGNIYGFPNIASMDNMFNMRFWYNEGWLTNLGLPIPTTLDEFYDTLVAFRDQDADGDGDPSNEIPFSGSWDEGYLERAPITSAMGFNSNGGYLGLNFLSGEPEADYLPYSDQYRDYIEYMKTLYDEGLLDPDMFTQSEIQYNAKTMEGRVGFGGGAADYIMNADADVYCGFIPMSSNVYETPLYTKSPSSVNSISMIINADVSDEKAIVLAKLGDALMDCRTAMECILNVDAGSELDLFGWGVTYNPETKKMEHVSPEDLDAWTFICRYMSPWSIPGYSTQPENAIPYCEQYPETQQGQEYIDKGGYTYEEWNTEFQGKCLEFVTYTLPNFYMTDEDQARITELVTPLDDYAKTMEAQFITGAASLDDYDKYIATLEELGVQEYIEIYAKYWDTYYANLAK